MALTVHDWMIERDSSPEPPQFEPPSANSLNIPDEAYGASTAYAIDPTLPLGPNDWDEADRANAARVDELNNEFIDLRNGILHDGDDAFFNRTGRDAILAAPEVHAKLEAARQETLGRAANDVQRQWLTETLGKHKIGEHFDIADHAGRQSVAWQKSINRGRLDRLNQQAGRDYADPKMVEALANASEGSARDHARASGLRPDSPEAQAEVDIARSSVFRHAIEGALAKGAHSIAIKLHDRAKDKLVPGDAEFLDKIIEDAREMKIGKDYVAKIAPLSLTINTSLEDLDRAQDEATAKNNEDWKDNDKQRAANQHFIKVQFGKAKRQVEADKAKLAQTVRDWLTAPGPDGLPQTERPPFVIWGKLTPGERKDVDTILETNAREQVLGDTESRLGAGRGISPQSHDIADQEHYANSANEPEIMSDSLPEPMEDGQQYAQARRGGGGVIVTPVEALRVGYYHSHLRAIRQLDPTNPNLYRYAPRGWIPRQEDVEMLHRELLRLQQKRAGGPEVETSPPPGGMGGNRGPSIAEWHEDPDAGRQTRPIPRSRVPDLPPAQPPSTIPDKPWHVDRFAQNEIRQMALKIATGHSFRKHVINRGEFPGVHTYSQFADHIQHVMTYFTEFKLLPGGRVAYWHGPSKTLVIVDPLREDGGTAYRPEKGRREFDAL